MLRLSFTTLGCPAWSWEQIVHNAAAMGYDGIELRGIQGVMRLKDLSIFQEDAIQRTMEQMRQAGLVFSCLDTSCNFHDLDRLEDSFAESRETVDLAVRVGAPYVRTFGDKFLPGESMEDAARRVAAGLDRMGAYAQGKGVMILLETHGEFASGAKIRAIMEKVTSPAVGVLWDIHHPYKYGGESMEETYRLLAPWIRHVHVKDSRGPWASHQLCNVGDGDLPIAACVQVLKAGGYGGWLSFEHEKAWHPEIAEPEEAFPAYIAAMRPLL